ncbi:cyclin-C1-1 isoform X2 [Raphanus sativus]|uniref:Cyclin-C1-1 isoform X2 n=1 Tax=Raphanus sativus TaxID=3726 RepID=A0A6J0JLW2_RAPSA|nr:cyclin-C1-1 isoform X2 [Raphanus sativus]
MRRDLKFSPPSLSLSLSLSRRSMAANFWNSSHYKQLLEQEEVDVVHPLDKERGISVEDFKLIKFHMSTHMIKLAQHIKVRQRVVATAITYMRRVYTRKSMVEFEPRLVALACMYLASKAEESIVQARSVIFCIRKLYPDEYKYELKDVLGMEMKVLEALNFYLVVFHPYRSLSEFLQDAAINDVNMNQITWGIVNDTYKMDLILVHPPYRIALACIYIASVHREKDITAWFEDLHEDMNLVKNIAMEILDFYENYRSITEEKVNSAFSKLALKP